MFGVDCKMDLICIGKTKNVFSLNDDTLLLKFKDDATGTDGKFDPGANTVGLTIEGAGKAGLKLSVFFFKKIQEAGILTHYISSDFNNNTMTVMKAVPFAKGVEVILRYRAVGSFVRRYGLYCNNGDRLDSYTEITLKDDERNDPLITAEGLQALNIMTIDEYKYIIEKSKQIGTIIKEELAKKNMQLYDIKLEFGKVGPQNKIALIDELSGGNMRVYKDNQQVHPITLAQLMLD